MKKKSNRKAIIRKLDKIFADKVKEGGICQLAYLDNITCKGNLQTMHIISRKYKILRWDFKNAMAGCMAHHFFYTNNPWLWHELIMHKFPATYDYVNSRKNEAWDKDLSKIEAELINT